MVHVIKIVSLFCTFALPVIGGRRSLPDSGQTRSLASDVLKYGMSGATKFSFGKDWKTFDEQCLGEEQSPIDVQTTRAILGEYPPLTRTISYVVTPDNMIVSKGIFNLVVKPLYNESTAPPQISGGPLHGNYVLDHVTFHWGLHNGIGSEHSINGVKYPLEMQAVHILDEYKSYKDAINKPNSIAILSYLFQARTDGHLGLDLIQKVFGDVSPAGEQQAMAPQLFPISILLPPIHKYYLTYQGSLTLPPCSEEVTWIVSYKPLHIRKRQMDMFRMLYRNATDIVNNYRPRQPVNKRLVYMVK